MFISARSVNLCLTIPALLSLLLAAALAFPGAAAVQQQLGASGTTSSCTASGFGNVHHVVRTTSPEAQKLFDHGLALDYGFNHGQAKRCFERAAELDPRMPMAYWGIALVLGTNYNMPIDAEGEKQAYEAVQKALALSAGGPPASGTTSRRWLSATPTRRILITENWRRPITTPCARSTIAIPTTSMLRHSSPRAA